MVNGPESDVTIPELGSAAVAGVAGRVTHQPHSIFKIIPLVPKVKVMEPTSDPMPKRVCEETSQEDPERRVVVTRLPRRYRTNSSNECGEPVD